MKIFFNIKYIIKSNLRIIILFLIFIYIIALPLCISAIMDSSGNREIIIYGFMQKLFLIPSMILLSSMYSYYVEREYKEIIYSLDRKCKYINIVIIYMLIQILLLPFYIGMIIQVVDLLPYILLFLIQMITLFNVYYLLSKFIDISFVILGCMLCYMCVYLFMLYEIGFGNIFVIDIPLDLISCHYFISIMVVSLLSVVCGIVLEKRRIHLLRQ